MQLVNNQTGSVEDVPDDQAEDAFKGGTHSWLHSEQQVPIRAPDGSLVSVSAKNAQAALELGGHVASQEEWHKADLDAKYGDVGHALAAAGEGVGRGLTLGLQDPLAIGVSRMIGGDAAAEATRQHLKGVKEESPWLSGGGEVAGAILPVLLSGGAAAPEEAAALGGERLAAAGAERLGAEAVAGGAERAAAEGVETAASGVRPPLVPPPAAKAPGFVSRALQYTPAGLTSNLGLAAERAASSVLGTTAAKGAVGRIVAAGAKAAAAAAVESPIYAAGNYLDESYLGNEDLNGEKFVAAVGHGFLYGTLFGTAAGAGLSTLGEAAGPLLRRAKPYMIKKAGEEAFSAPGPMLAHAKRAVEFGGTSESGQTYLRRGVLGDTLSDAASITPEKMVPRFDVALDTVRKEIESIRNVNGLSKPAEVTAQEVRDAIDQHIAPLRRGVITKDDAEAVEKFRDDMLEHFGAIQRDRIMPAASTDTPERQMWKSLEPNAYATAEAEKRAGGVDTVGKALIDAGVKPIPVGGSYEDFFGTIDKAADAAGAHVGALAEAANVAGAIPRGKILDAIDTVIDRVRSKAAHEPIVASLEDAKMSIAERLGIKIDRAGAHDDAVAGIKKTAKLTKLQPGTARWNEAVDQLEKSNINKQLRSQAGDNVSFATLRGTRQDIDQIAFREARSLDPKLRVEYLREIRSELADLELSAVGDAKLGEEYQAAKKQYQRLLIAQKSADGARMKRLRGFMPKVKVIEPEFGPARLLADKMVSGKDIAEQRVSMGEKLYPHGTPGEGYLYPDGSPRMNAMRNIHESLGDLEMRAMENAAKGTKLEGVSKELKKRMQEYAQLQIGRDAAQHSTARMARNRSLSLTDYLSHSGGGVAGALGGLATGHLGVGIIAGQAANWAGRYVHKMSREHGNAIAAWGLSRIANLDLIARATRSVDSELDAAIGSLTGRTKPRLRVRRFSGPDDKSAPEKKYEDAHKSITPYRDVTEEHVENAIPGMTQHAPLTSGAITRAINTGAVYLKSKMPTPLNAPSIVDPNPKPRVDDVTAEEFHSVRRAVEDPVGVLRDGIEDGKITRAQVEAIQATKPALVEDVQRKLLEELAKPRKEPLSYDRLTSISLIFGVAADPTLDPQHVAAYQNTYAPAGGGGAGGAAKTSSSPAKLSGLKSFSQGATLGLDRAGQH